MRAVTGTPFILPPPSGIEMQKLTTAIATCCPEVSGRSEWARDQAMRWARVATKRTVHGFVDWLNSEAFGTPQPDARSSAGVDERQRQRDTEWKELVKTRAAPPPEAVKLAKGGPRR